MGYLDEKCILSQSDIKIVDPVALNAVKGILGELIKKIFKAIAEGKPLSSVSFPVRLHAPESLGQRFTCAWSFVPNYMPQAALMKDPVERIKNVVAILISGFHISMCKTRGPFNAFMGETFQ